MISTYFSRIWFCLAWMIPTTPLGSEPWICFQVQLTLNILQKKCVKAIFSVKTWVLYSRRKLFCLDVQEQYYIGTQINELFIYLGAKLSHRYIHTYFMMT